MRHYLDLSTDELRALYIVIPHDHPFECLKETVAKMERFLEITKQAQKHPEVWGEDAFIK